MENLDNYVHRDERLLVLLDRMRVHAKTFLLTNSDYEYTNVSLSTNKTQM